VSRSTRASIASSLLLFSLLAAACGESTTHSAAEVRRVLVAHGIETEAYSTEPPREYRTQAHAAELRIGLQLSYYASRLAGLAERKTARVNLAGDDVTVIVAQDPADAAWIAHVFGARGLFGPEHRVRTRRIDNVVILAGGPRVDAALEDLRY
jgi:hypothetical protein